MGIRDWGSGLIEPRAPSPESRVSPTNHVAAIDPPSEERAGTGADDGAQRLRISRRQYVSGHAADDAANDQSGGAIVTAAVVSIVHPPVDSIVPAQTLHLVLASIIRTIVAGRV